MDGRDAWLASILNDGQGTSQPRAKPRIKKVPQTLREGNTKYFDPHAVAIGPYHSGNSKLMIKEDDKKELAKHLIVDPQLIEAGFYKVREVAPTARECYSDCTKTEFNDETFERMMFLDGCFVLHFINCIVNNKYNEFNTLYKFLTQDSLLRDLFLLENQLPFVVLEALMSSICIAHINIQMVTKFIKQQTSTRFSSQGQSSNGGAQPHHLLDLLRTELVSTARGNPSPANNYTCYTPRTVKELRSVGIGFKKSTSCLNDVHFKPYKILGDILLPQITINHLTRPRFFNLIAYEMCLDDPSDYVIHSFFSFLDSLISRADDVKDLRSKQILLQSLGQNERIVDFFKQLATELMPDPSAYGKVKEDIESHCKNKMKIFIGGYGKTLAIVCSFSYALLFFIQTFFTVFPREGKKQFPF